MGDSDEVDGTDENPQKAEGQAKANAKETVGPAAAPSLVRLTPGCVHREPALLLNLRSQISPPTWSY